MTHQTLLILGMALVTYLPRALPLMLLSDRPLPAWLTRWLSLVAPAIFGALLAPSLWFVYKKADETGQLSRDYTFLLAAVPAFLIGWFTRSFIAVILSGMAATALLRHFHFG